MLTYLEIAQRLRPRWIVWENVPGVLSSNGGRDFGSFLGALGELGYGWAYRVLDAQWCRTHRHQRAVPQRRRRVFVVGCLGDGTAAAAVLFERESVRRDTAARRATRQGSAADAEGGAGEREQVVGALTAKGPDDFGAAQVDANHYIPCTVPFCATSFAKYETGVGTLRREGGDLGGGSETLLCCTAAHAVAFTRCDNGQDAALDHTPTMRCGSNYSAHLAVAHAVAFSCKDHGADAGMASPTLRAMGHGESHANGGGQVAVAHAMIVRRLTPRECERLQGFPDDYTAIPWRGKTETPDGPRYKALGNSMAVNCMEWIGERIAAQEVTR
jgi:DNA (cytosine-5)-methyltransferase 1